MTLRDKLTVFWLISSELWGREVNILPYFRAELTVIFFKKQLWKMPNILLFQHLL